MTATVTTFLILLSTGIAADPPPAPLGPSESEKVEIARLIRDLAHSDFDIREAAAALGCSASQLVRFIAKAPEALAAVNAVRAARGLHRLQP